MGTWEQAEASARDPDRLCGRANKIEAGNGDLQRLTAGARRKFRGAIAQLGARLGVLELAAAGVDQVALGRIRQLPTRRAGNGGKLPISPRPIGRVGRPVLEGSAQGAGIAGDLGARPKLGRLSSGDLVELGAPELLELGAGAIAADFAPATPGAPNRAAGPWAMLALHAGGIWIEGRAAAGELAQAAVSAGHVPDRSTATLGLNAQTDDRRRGPGGNAAFGWAVTARSAPNGEAGRRAGVNFPPAIARPHETGANQTLRAIFADVKGLAA